ncbi:TatD family hydrolase [Motilimonas cestriensis]|uniref:TatD family hydrolase n=1 Tax=Motilimonas cestriensis TaxID=2742685 RepID=UPI003DA28259
MIDIGINLTNKRFDKDRGQVIAQAQDAGVTGMIVTGTNLAESQAAAELAAEYPGYLYATAGVHPHDAKSVSESTWASLRELWALPQVKAVGECGLDYNRDFSPRPVQDKVFEQQLELAVELQLPVFMHERDARARFIDILKPYRERLPAAVLHCFTGELDDLKAYLDLDLHIGITGWICDERRGLHLHQAVKLIPGNRLMIETDSPYLLPRTLRPKPKSSRNLPQYLPHIAQTIADARGQNIAELIKQATATSEQFFSL